MADKAEHTGITDDLVDALYRVPAPPADARRKPNLGGLPERPGLYAWWLVPGALPEVRSPPHPRDDVDLDLLYVGIAPNSATSKQTLRSRVLNNHLGGNTGSSTFRFSLAAILMNTEEFRPLMTTTKYVLTREDNRRLSDWQQTNLFLTWCEHPEPWTGEVERDVIAAMQPPMNLAENSGHPFHAAMSGARSRFREAARERRDV